MRQPLAGSRVHRRMLVRQQQAVEVKLLYKIEEGKRWRIGNIVVHINGDNPHTKIQTALNRLSIDTSLGGHSNLRVEL